MAVISDTNFKNIINKFELSPNYYYDDTVDNMLGTGKWSLTDVDNTVKRFNEAGYSAKSYYNSIDKGTKYEGRLWIKVVRGTIVESEVTELPKSESVAIKYYRNHVYHVCKYLGNIESLPSWITDTYKCELTGKPDGEFKLILGNDNWELVQIDDIIVYDTVRNRFTIFDSDVEFNKLFISEVVIAESLSTNNSGQPKS